MEDASKVQKLKLATSRKRFKELQQLKKKKNEKDHIGLPKSGDLIAVDSNMINSNHGTINEMLTDDISYVSSKLRGTTFFDNFVQQENDYEKCCEENNSNTPECLSTFFFDNKGESDGNIKSSMTSSNIGYKYTSGQQDMSLCCEPNDCILDSSINMLQQNNPCDSTEYLRSDINKGNLNREGLNENKINDFQYSNIESLKQLSNEVAELIIPQLCLPESNSCSHSTTDLEKRNLELSVMLEKEKVTSKKNITLIEELKSKVISLENTINEGNKVANEHANREINNLKDELESHLQTIGILVAEKTELHISVNKFELCFKQKTAECEELQARLKASRSRVAELERDISQFKSKISHIENTLLENNTLISNLTYDNQIIKQQKDELAEDVLQTKENLKIYVEENLKLKQLNHELTTKLKSADIKLKQILCSDQQELDTDLDKVTQEKFLLEKQLADLQESLKYITKEHDESVLQYQQYSQQQNLQLNNLTRTLEILQTENENLILQEQNRIKHISDIEKQLQNLQTEQVTFATDKSINRYESKTNLESVKQICVQLQMEKVSLEENYTKVSNERDLLLKELDAKSESLSQLESLVEQLQGNQPDSVKLLATMESDKVAAARAVQQNKELKQQVESLEEVFVKLNNDKVELTEQLSKEIKNNKELFLKLQTTEIHLQRLTEAIEIKDKELLDLREEIVILKKQFLQNEQVGDLLKHYEVQDTTNHTLQNELEGAKERISKLTHEINILKHCLNDNSNKIEDNNVDLARDLKSESLMVGNKDYTELEVSQVNNALDKQIAIKYLEDKFKHTMQDVADLKEEKQNLEHLILQLQGETETIGEYVALYHQQRMMLKQKALEKDNQLKLITVDRENLKSKIWQLDKLVRKLVYEKHAKTEAESHFQFQNLSEKHSMIPNAICDTNRELINQNNENTLITDNIIMLLSEIKSSNLIQPDECIHHCACCSGQLITV